VRFFELLDTLRELFFLLGGRASARSDERLGFLELVPEVVDERRL
jgi:hypothetical protein